jgi:hypothetical protein
VTRTGAGLTAHMDVRHEIAELHHPVTRGSRVLAVALIIFGALLSFTSLWVWPVAPWLRRNEQAGGTAARRLRAVFGIFGGLAAVFLAAPGGTRLRNGLDHRAVSRSDTVLGDGGNCTVYRRRDGSQYALDRSGRGVELTATRILGPAKFDTRALHAKAIGVAY